MYVGALATRAGVTCGIGVGLEATEDIKVAVRHGVAELVTAGREVGSPRRDVDGAVGVDGRYLHIV